MTGVQLSTIPLADSFGRVATDLRVSLTDKCNLRCTYCMPADGLPWIARDELLTDEETIRLVTVAVEMLGIREVRFTGGEPLLRPGLVAIIAATSALIPRPDVSLTTNGIGLERVVDELAANGLTRINVSLDTLRPDRFATLARRDRLPDVLRGMRAAQEAGLSPVKANAVLIRGVNEDEAPDLLRFCLDNGYELRFIEQMPLDADHTWRQDNLVTGEEILASLTAHFTLTPVGEARGSAPAERWLVDGGPATVGVIASVTRPFCAACARTRLTADGQVRNCLFSTGETDLRGLVRGGASDAEIAERWRSAMWGKASGHGIGTPAFSAASRSMSAIGG
ncbi:MAG: GTP 3',8-cyclase MoaA [Actinomycetota bacterium]|nr:GTP 3',8-cyclase MoaA [Actinomycetota bacterium]